MSIADLERQLEEARRELLEVRHARDDWRARFEAAAVALDRAMEDYHDAAARVADLERQILSQRQELADRATRIADLETPDSAGERIAALERVADVAQWLVDDGVVQIGEPLYEALTALRAQGPEG